VTAAAQPEERDTPSAAQLDQQRREAAALRQEQLAEAAAATATAVTQTQAPAPAVTQTQAPAPAPVVPAVREGDVIDAAELDVIPKPLRPIAPVYPAIARQQKIAATIVLTAFINENGQVTDVRVLRGDARFGLNDAAMRAMRVTRWSAPMKDGKRVRTWLPQTIEFRP
jgi:TonB family protein